MSLEKGISRTGTVLGAFIGCYLSLIVVESGLECADHFKNKYDDKKYMEHCCYPDKEDKDLIMVDTNKLFDESKKRVFLRNLSENHVEKIRPVYLPTLGMGILLVFVPFIFGFYMLKGVTGTLNWLIKGFRE